MEIFYIIFGVAILGLLVYQVFFRKEVSVENETLQRVENEKNILVEELTRFKIDLERKNTDFGKIQNELERSKTERDKFFGKNKELFVQTKDLQSDLKHVREDASTLKKTVSDFQAREKQKESELAEKIKKLEHAQKSLEDEKVRVRREDEARQAQILDEKNRIWNDHEVLVLAKLRETCERPEIGFNTFDNQKLPNDFDGTLKPDFLVEFLGQYIIFDAKQSKSPQTYLNNQVKETAKKCKNNDKIYSTIFFIMPDESVATCKKLSFHEDGFSFFVIPISAIESILANFKKITEYERIQDFDPQDRENIVNMIANYDRHISFQNAANILLAKESVGLMNSKENLPENFQSEIDIRKQSMRNFKLKDSDLKKVSQNLDEQTKAVEKLTSPRVAVEKIDLENAQDSLHL